MTEIIAWSLVAVLWFLGAVASSFGACAASGREKMKPYEFDYMLLIWPFIILGAVFSAIRK